MVGDFSALSLVTICISDIRAYRTLVHFMAYHPSWAINDPVKIQ